MTFPTITAENPTTDDSAGGAATSGSTAATSHSVVLPATVNAGDLLMIFGRVAVAGTVAITGGGWTIVQDSSDGSDDVTFFAWRDTLADGTEDGTSVTVTHGNGKMSAYTKAIGGAEDPATQAPEHSTVAVANSTTPDPTACTPTGGAKDYYWIWFGGWEGEQTLSKTVPTNYTGTVDVSSGTGGVITTNTQIKVCRRTANASSEDPGSVTLSVADDWTAWTIAIHPASSTTLAIQNSAQAQTTGAVVLVPDLVIQNSTQAQTTQAVVLVPDLVIQNSAQTQTTNNVVLSLPGIAITELDSSSRVSNNVSLDASGATADDKLLAVIWTNGTAGTTPTGWALEDTEAGPFTWTQYLYSRTAVASMGTVDFPVTGGDSGYGRLFQAHDSEGSTPEIDVLASTNAGDAQNNYDAPSVTLSIAGKLFCSWIGIDSGVTLTKPASMTLIGSQHSTVLVEIAAQESVASGATGVRNATTTGNHTWIALSVGLIEGGAGTDLVIQNSSQAQTTQAVVLVPDLLIQNSQQGQTTTSVVLVPNLVIQNGQQNQTIQNVVLIPNLVIQNSQQAQTTQNVVLVPDLAIQNSQQAQAADNVTLTAGGVDLVIQNSAQAQTTQAVVLIPNLVIQNSAQAQTTQAVVLVPDLVIQNSSQAQTTQSVTLVPNLIIQNSQQAQNTDNVTLALEGDLIIQNSQQAQTTQSVVLVPDLVIQNSSQAQATDNVLLATDLVIQNSAQSQITDSVTLVLTLTIQNSLQAQTTQGVTLVPNLVIQNSQQAQTADNVILSTTAPSLTIQNSLQVQTTTSVTLIPNLEIQNSFQAQVTDEVFLNPPLIISGTLSATGKSTKTSAVGTGTATASAGQSGRTYAR